MIGQAEHGPSSLAVLLTNSMPLAEDTPPAIEKLLGLPTAAVAREAWQDNGEIIVCDTLDEMMAEADRIASEHAQVMTGDPGYFFAPPDELRSVVSTGADQCGVWRQSDRHQPHAAHDEGGALHGRAVGRQVHQDLHVSARVYE